MQIYPEKYNKLELSASERSFLRTVERALAEEDMAYYILHINPRKIDAGGGKPELFNLFIAPDGIMLFRFVEVDMGEVVNTTKLALSDMDIFDDVHSYIQEDNYSDYIDSEGGKSVDEQFWAACGSQRGITITFYSDGKGNYDIGKGVINDMSQSGSVAQPKMTEEVFLESIPLLYKTIAQVVNDHLKMASATYRNSCYTVFVKFEVVGGFHQATITGSFNGMNLSDDSDIASGEGCAWALVKGKHVCSVHGTTDDLKMHPHDHATASWVPVDRNKPDGVLRCKYCTITRIGGGNPEINISDICEWEIDYKEQTIKWKVDESKTNNW